MKSLFLGALALALAAGAAVAAQAYQDAAPQPTATVAPANQLSRSTADISKKVVDPSIFDPTHSVRSRGDTADIVNNQTTSAPTGFHQAAAKTDPGN
jgi:opacity protein-like surface antigen